MVGIVSNPTIPTIMTIPAIQPFQLPRVDRWRFVEYNTIHRGVEQW